MCIRDSISVLKEQLKSKKSALKVAVKELSKACLLYTSVTKGMIITVRYFKEDTAHPEVCLLYTSPFWC